MVTAAEKLDESVNAARLDLQRLRDEEDRVREEERRLYEARSVAASRLSRLKKVREKVRSKEYRLVEQGLRKLEADEQKESNNLEAESLGAQVAHQSPSADSYVVSSYPVHLTSYHLTLSTSW